MFSFKASNVYEAAKPLHTFSGFIGLTSFTIEENYNVFTSRTTLFNVICISSFTIWSVIFGAMFLMVGKDSWIDGDIFVSETLEKSVGVTIFVFLLISAVVSWWMFLEQKNFSKIFNLLVESDEQLMDLNVAIDLKKQKKIVLFFIAMVKCLAIFFAFLSILNSHRENIYKADSFCIISMCIFLEFHFFIILQFLFLMWSVRLRLEKLNDFLRQSFLKMLTGCAIDETFTNLPQVAKLHDKLVDVSEAINRCYGFPMLVIMANSFIYVTICIFSLIRLSFQKVAVVTLIYVTTTAWIFYYCAMMYSVTYMGHYTTREAVKTAKILHRISNEDLFGTLNKRIITTSQQLMHRLPVFSCGLFHFNLHLAFKMLSAAVVYLVFLVQFEMSEIYSQKDSFWNKTI